MGGAIRVARGEYFLGSFIKMHGENVTLFGNGFTEIVFLQRPYVLTIEGQIILRPLMVNKTRAHITNH